MQFCRLYTGDDGQSYFEDFDQGEGSKHFLTNLSVKALVFKNDMNRDDLHGWHPAPRRQWCTKRTFGPGDVFLAEDETGHGHTAVPKNWVRAFVHL